MVLNITKLDGNQARFGFLLGDEVWKIVYYFLQPDKSLGVGSYFQGNASAIIDLPESDVYKANIDHMEALSIGFKPNKTSFHISGKLVSKDKSGNRYSDSKDSSSIPFSDIKDVIQIRCIYPSNLGDYKKVLKEEIVNVFEPQYHEPSMVKFFLSSSSFDFKNWMTSIDPESIVYEDKVSLSDFKLIIYTVCRKSNNKFIPRAEIVADVLF